VDLRAPAPPSPHRQRLLPRPQRERDRAPLPHRVLQRGPDDAHRHAALNPAILEVTSELNTLLQEGGGEEAEECDTAAAVPAACPHAAAISADVDVARRVVAR